MTQIDVWNNHYDYEMQRYQRRIRELHIKLRKILNGEKVYADAYYDDRQEILDNTWFVETGLCTH